MIPYIYGFGCWEGNEYTDPTGETTIDYTYPTNYIRPHAVTARSNGDSFSYDDNGNMTSRTQDGVTWTQGFDAENRLIRRRLIGIVTGGYAELDLSSGLGAR